MAKYRQWFTAEASGYVEIEADSPEEAEAKIEAEIGDPGILCARCSGWGQVTGIDLDEWEVDIETNEGQPVLIKK